MTGCEVNYNLKIGENGIVETVNVLTDNETEYQKILTQYEIPVSLYFGDSGDRYNVGFQEGIDYYERYLVEENTQKGLKYIGYFGSNSIRKSNIINSCFENFNFLESDNKIYISTSNNMYCYGTFSGDGNVYVNIESDYMVIYNNADRVDRENNIYTFIFNANNYTDKNISITIDKDYPLNASPEETPVEDDEDSSFSGFYILLIFLIVIMLLSVISYFIYKRNNKKNNSI